MVHVFFCARSKNYRKKRYQYGEYIIFMLFLRLTGVHRTNILSMDVYLSLF